MAIGPLKEQYHSSLETSFFLILPVFALTFLSLLALSQARLDYTLQCARGEIGIRWPSYHSNSEYYVCPSIYGSQLTIHCPAGEVFTFVLQQCVSPAHYIPAPPMDVLPTAAPITMNVIDNAPPVISALSQPETPVHHEHHEHQEHQEHHEHHEVEVEAHPIPPTPAPEPPTPPTVAVKPVVPVPGKKVPVPVPGKKATVPVPSKAAMAKKPAAAPKKPAAPTPSKAAKKPTPPSKAQKKPATA
ncbi:vegetative cell wall protein gp1 [Drosophila teissieri]|uniref:vegetative cell wall protein gp1 n=1 Tax=Drosophila teissieri TaxID=7243 RepID=UPI001CB9E605|nr:vegetative cell wall protein gp1 [Drosophila teissieri]